MKEQHRVELHISAPQTVAEAIMLFINNMNLGQYESFEINNKKSTKHQFENGVVIGKLPMKVLQQALTKSKKEN